MTQLFKDYPTIEYKVDGISYFLKDFTRRAAFFNDLREDYEVVAEYQIEEGEHPTSLAQDFYGNPELFWTLLYINNIVDPFFDWPMSYVDLQTWIEATFTNPDNIQYYTYDEIRYETPTQVEDLKDLLGVTTSSELLEVSGVLGITYRVHQELVNDEKRSILVIRPDKMSTVINRFKEVFRK